MPDYLIDDEYLSTYSANVNITNQNEYALILTYIIATTMLQI